MVVFYFRSFCWGVFFGGGDVVEVFFFCDGVVFWVFWVFFFGVVWVNFLKEWLELEDLLVGWWFCVVFFWLFLRWVVVWLFVFWCEWSSWLKCWWRCWCSWVCCCWGKWSVRYVLGCCCDLSFGSWWILRFNWLSCYIFCVECWVVLILCDWVGGFLVVDRWGFGEKLRFLMRLGGCVLCFRICFWEEVCCWLLVWFWCVVGFCCCSLKVVV